MPATTPAVPDLTTLSPPEIDELWSAAIEPAARALQAAHEELRSGRRYRNAGASYADTAARKLERGAAMLAQAQADYAAASAPFDAEFERRGRWTRYVLVIGSSGHVHSPYCHTLTPGQTFISPVFELSGQDGAGVVVAAGHTACSHCFPDAPVQTVEDKRAANVARGRCAGTGEQATAFTANRRYGRCGTCGGTFGVSTYGKLRPHKPEAS
jgi:hypothetical protein